MFTKMSRATAIMVILTLLIGMTGFSFADSAPAWNLNKDYEEGDYVKFRGSIYISLEDHVSNTDNYPWNLEYWVDYKKGAGYKKGEEPTKKDDKEPNDDKKRSEAIYTEDGIDVYYSVKKVETDGYEASITLYNSTENDVKDWSLSFEFDEDEEILESDDVSFEQDNDDVEITPVDESEIDAKGKISFKLEIEADVVFIEDEEDEDNDEDDDDDDVDYKKKDKKDKKDKKNNKKYDREDSDEDDNDKEVKDEVSRTNIELPDNFDLKIEWTEPVDEDVVNTGVVLIKIEEPDFDEDIFIPEVKLGQEEQLIEWGEQALYTDLTAGKTYTVYADQFETDTHDYKPVFEERKVKVSNTQLKEVTISYKAVKKDIETGRVLVYAFKPEFDEDLFEAEVTIDDETEEIGWGEYVYFDDLEAGETFDVLVEDIEIDDVTYVAELNVDEIKIDDKKMAYVLIKYEEVE